MVFLTGEHFDSKKVIISMHYFSSSGCMPIFILVRQLVLLVCINSALIMSPPAQTINKTPLKSDLKWYESFQNRLCQLWIKACRSSISPNFSLDEVKQAVGELKLGRSADLTGMVREIFKKCGDGLLYLLVEMVNTIKASKNLPSD